MGDKSVVSVGDIHWLDLPAANGREQRGRRPAVVMQDDGYGGALPVILMAPLTTAKTALRYLVRHPFIPRWKTG
jgi:mRNA-degrading endonuclease toxin of MazEF toxin-antitoxin module